MRLSNFSIVLVAMLIVRTCVTEIIIKTPQPDGSFNLVKATVKILTSCYGKRVNTVGLAGNLPGALLRELWAEQSISTVVLDDTIVSKGPIPRKYRNKLETFVVIASTSTELKKICSKIKSSLWWSHLASFIILDWTSLSHIHACSNASELLLTAWDMNLLNAKVMCHHETKGPLIYNFNPYTNEAPNNWQIEGIYTGMNFHPWTLFLQEYRDNKDICVELDFDKTKDLGGYEIRTSVAEMHFYESRTDRSSLSPFQIIMIQLLFPALNAKYKPLLLHTFDSIGYVDEKGIAHGIVADVVSAISDIAILPRYAIDLINFTYTYPHWESGLSAITQYNGYMSQLDKIASLLDSRSKIGFYLVCLSAVIFFKYFERQALTPAILNFVRIFSNTALTKVPKNLSSRIYLGGLLLFVLNITGVYQGKMATLLTKQAFLPNVNTLKDLRNLGYTIYGHKEFASFFNDPIFKGRYIGSKTSLCTDHVLKNKTAACINDRFALIHDAAEFTLHLSRDPIVKLYWVYPIREDWPLEQRVNIVLQRFVEANLLQPLHARKTRKILRILDVNESLGGDEDFGNLTLDELKFLFIILFTGLICATVAFILEVAIKRFRSSNINSKW